MSQHQGFTLVEIAISLLVVGLLIGGIMMGQDLLRTSHLQAVVAAEGQYTSAVKQFTEKYYALPGDIPNAVTFWGRADDGTYAGNCGTPAADTGTGTQTCNGNGNGQIDAGTHEMFRVWQHLANAELIDGAYTGITAGAMASLHRGGTNSPRTDMQGATWGMRYSDNTASATEFQVLLRNHFAFGVPNTTNGFPDDDALTPAEAASIDTKLDDGVPGTGNIIAIGGYADCTDASASNDFVSAYVTTTEAPECALAFKGGF